MDDEWSLPDRARAELEKLNASDATAALVMIAANAVQDAADHPFAPGNTAAGLAALMRAYSAAMAIAREEGTGSVDVVDEIFERRSRRVAGD